MKQNLPFLLKPYNHTIRPTSKLMIALSMTRWVVGGGRTRKIKTIFPFNRCFSRFVFQKDMFLLFMTSVTSVMLFHLRSAIVVFIVFPKKYVYVFEELIQSDNGISQN